MNMPPKRLLAATMLAALACGPALAQDDTATDPAQEAIRADQAQQAAETTRQDNPPPVAPVPPPMDPTAPPAAHATPPVAPTPDPQPTDAPPPSDIEGPTARLAPPPGMPPGTPTPAPQTQGTSVPPAAGTPTASGVTGNAETTSGDTVRSLRPDAVVGDYDIDMAALDKDGDGSLSREEAGTNATLTSEFDAVDNDQDGRLSKQELADWK